MNIRPFSPELIHDWDAFCDASPEAWWWHRSEWLAYCEAYRPGAVNRSFAVADDAGAILAICPLIQERDQFTMGGEPGAAPVARETVSADLCVDAVAVLAREHGIRRVAFRGSVAPYALIRDHGYHDVSWGTRLLDLTQPEPTLWRGIRKGHRADIRKAERIYTFQAGVEIELFAAYEWVHQVAHDRPRPANTYEYQSHWCEENALVVTASDPHWKRLANTTEAAAYFLIYKNVAYYASAAALVPDVMAAVVWRGILALKARGVKTLELGWNARPGDSEKTIAVSHFKRGMGGHDAPVYAVERRSP